MNTMNRLVILSKREHFEQLLKTTGTVRVTLDSRKPGVGVPPGFERQAELGLIITKFDKDVVAQPTELTATLSFNKQLSPVRIPWAAVFAITDETGDGMMWEEDTPQVVLDRLAKSNPQGSQVSDPLSSTKFRTFEGGVKTMRLT